MLAVLRRQAAVTLIGLLITTAGVAGVVRFFPPERVVKATVLLVPPAGTPRAGGPLPNPYLQMGGLGAPVEVLARSLNDPKIRKDIEARHPKVTYSAERDQNSSAPILLITVEGAERDQVQQVRDELLDLTPKSLANLQNDINVVPDYRITSTIVSAENDGSMSLRSSIRAALVVDAIGMLLTLAIATFVDRRRRSDQEREAPETADRDA